MALKGKRIAILATDGFEYSELAQPKDVLEKAGAEVDVVSPKGGKIRGVRAHDWDDGFEVDIELAEADPDLYDGLVLPGGVYNPDSLRTEPDAIGFINRVFAREKPVAAICHGPWLLIEAGIISGRRATSYKSIVTDMRNAGANWVDEPVVEDGNIITSRHPGDLDAFCKTLIKRIEEAPVAA